MNIVSKSMQWETIGTLKNPKVNTEKKPLINLISTNSNIIQKYNSNLRNLNKNFLKAKIQA